MASWPGPPAGPAAPATSTTSSWTAGSTWGGWAPRLRLAAGLAIGVVFVLRAGMSKAEPLTVAGFEVEDVLYLMPVVALVDGMAVFLVLAGVGAPLFLIFTAARR